MNSIKMTDLHPHASMVKKPTNGVKILQFDIKGNQVYSFNVHVDGEHDYGAAIGIIKQEYKTYSWMGDMEARDPEILVVYPNKGPVSVFLRGDRRGSVTSLPLDQWVSKFKIVGQDGKPVNPPASSRLTKSVSRAKGVGF